VIHEPRVTVGQTVGSQVTSAQVFLFVRIQTIPFLGFHAYKTRSRKHFIAPHSYIAAGAFGHHYSHVERQSARIFDHHLEINFENGKTRVTYNSLSIVYGFLPVTVIDQIPG